MRSLFVALVLVLAVSGCGESSAEKNAKARREDNRVIQQLSQSTRTAADAGKELAQAERRHREAEKALRVAEGH